MITTVSPSGIIGDDHDIEEFFAARTIDLERFDTAATSRLAQIVSTIDGRIDEYSALSDEPVNDINSDELGCGFELEPGNRATYVNMSLPVLYDAAYEAYAYVDGFLVTVRLELAALPVELAG